MSEAQRRKREQSRQRANLIWAICHPSRRRILRRIGDAGAPCEPARLAEALELSPGATAYHVAILRRFGALRPAGEEGGEVEPLYVTTIEDDPPIEALLEETRDVDETNRAN